MNLDQIATKCFILALFIRDDGERLLLGDGFYDFKSNLQHFQANTIANDIVELQGDNGQLLAGQVMRSGAQKFEGYIGDATTNRQTIEQKRSDFMAFFRIKHFYKVIYIFPDGTAIQRRRGYLTDAPAVPEIFQKFPEYSIALNFEDANYYEYAEDESGDEIYAHIAELALAGVATGGLIWDAIGAVTNGITWSGIQTAQGEYISITNSLDIPAKLASVEMLGKATQDGTPTPDSPVPVQTTTGENVVKIEGKNLCYVANLVNANSLALFAKCSSIADSTITLSLVTNATTTGCSVYAFVDGVDLSARVGSLITTANTRSSATLDLSSVMTQIRAGSVLRLLVYRSGAGFTSISEAQLELGSTATAYEPYQGQEFEINLGKNLLQPMTGLTNQGLTGTANSDGTITVTGTATNTYSFITNTTTQNIPAGTYTFSDGLEGQTCRCIARFTYADNTSVECDLRNQGAGRSVTLTQTATKCQIRLTNITSGTTYNLTVKPQVEVGQATAYAPYFTPIELAKIGNYQDRIYKEDGKWYIEKQVGKVVLDGTEAWTATGGGNGYRIDKSDILTTPSTDIAPIITDHFTTTTFSSIYNATIDYGISNHNSNHWLVLRNKSWTSVSDATTWLSTHNTTVYYALATPTTTEITNEALIAELDALGASSLFVGVNNIGTETLNALPTLKIEYYTEYTLDGAGYEWEPGGNTAKTIVTVAGVDSAWPIWTVQGGAQNPTLTNITTGQTITWQGFVPEGQTLTINMAEMTADLAGANVFEYITGEWIRLAPGNNTLVYTAGSADKPSTLSWNGVLA